MWVTVCALSEQWHIPPWEVMRAPGGAYWSARWSAYLEAKRKASTGGTPVE